MTDEMIVDSLPFESDEAEDWESDEAYDESDDSVEDIGERARRRWNPSQNRYQNRPRYTQGVQGLRVRGQDGSTRNLRFPAKLATAAETNRGLASQEIGRRTLEQKLDRLEKRLGVRQKNNAAVLGLVTLGVGGGLSAYGAVQAANQVSGSKLANWANEPSTKMSTLISVTQLATTTAQLVVSKHYDRSGVRIVADVYSAAQIALFAFGSFQQPDTYKIVKDKDEAQQRAGSDPQGTLYLTAEGDVFRLEISGKDHALRPIR